MYMILFQKADTSRFRKCFLVVFIYMYRICHVKKSYVNIQQKMIIYNCAIILWFTTHGNTNNINNNNNNNDNNNNISNPNSSFKATVPGV